VRIPDFSSQPAEPVALRLGGMKAHDLTGAAPPEPPHIAMVQAPPSPMMVASAGTTLPMATHDGRQHNNRLKRPDRNYRSAASGAGRGRRQPQLARRARL
jgi:hypothetical protein